MNTATNTTPRTIATVRVNGRTEPITITPGFMPSPMMADTPMGDTLYERIIASRGNDELIRREQSLAHRHHAAHAGVLASVLIIGLAVLAYGAWLAW